MEKGIYENYLKSKMASDTLGDRLKYLRCRSKRTLIGPPELGIHMTQIRVADELELDPKTYNRYENSKTESISSDNVKRISEFYKVTCDWLIKGKNPDYIDIHEFTGLSVFAIEWLNENKEDIELMKIVNLVLGDKNIADSLFNALYLYANSPALKLVSIDEEIFKPRYPTHALDERLMLRNTIATYICEVLDSVLYKNKDKITEKIENAANESMKYFSQDFKNRYEKAEVLNKSNNILQEKNFKKGLEENT